MSDDIGANRGAEQKIQLLQEMRSKNFDVIRFASYRTACKLRFIQKKTHLHMIDIWNVIEAFRENGLNTLEAQTEVNVSRLELLVCSLYHNLNKRLPVSQQVNVESLSSLLLNWLLSAYAAETLRRIRVFSIKVALATMCAGKLMDKLRYLFSQLCDGNGHLIAWKLSEFLQQVLALPAAVYESPSFSYSDQLAANIFAGMSKVTVNDFMDTMMSDPGPSCLVWLPLLHRLAGIENVTHPTVCDGCQKDNFSGFRYKCMKCHNYQMCQECFWHGRVSGNHTLEHEVKEYTSYKSPSRQIGHSLRKSFRCVPDKGKTNIPRFPDEPEKTINLSHIVPPSPLPSHNGFADYDVSSMDSRSIARSPRYTSSLESTKLDDEHKLIARYAARLAHEARSVGRTPSEGSLSFDASRAQRELIQQLEAKNREIMREIARLRRQQELEGANCLEGDPELVSELKELRQRKDDLERHLSALQDSRRHLMLQLESLMKLLKSQQPSPRPTPNSSPRATKSPPPSRSAPPTPVLMPSNAAVDSLTNDMRSVFGAPSTIGASSSSLASLSGGGGQTINSHAPDGRSLRNDLLVAADSVTNAMSSLVRELNSEGSEDDHSVETVIQKKPVDVESEKKSNADKIYPKVEQDPKFLAELKAATQLRGSKNSGELVNGNGTNLKKVGNNHYPEYKVENWEQTSPDSELNDLR